jgi:hypothetical protein
VNTVDEPPILLQVVLFWRNQNKMEYVRGMGRLNQLGREE